MKTVVISILLCWAVMTHLSAGYSQQCYVCRGHDDSCRNPDVSTLGKETCTTSCMTLTLDNGYVNRGCSSMRGRTRCTHVESFLYDASICYCNSELCNDDRAPEISRMK